MNRRELLGSSAVLLLLLSVSARAATDGGALPWRPGTSFPPATVAPGGWNYFTPQEAAIVEALVDRLIPADPLSPGGKECGCAVFIDRQLAGPYGRNEGFYMSGPFQEGTKQQGLQSPVTPAQNYRKGLAALDSACRKNVSKPFAELGDEQKDKIIAGLEDGSFKLEGTDGQQFWNFVSRTRRPDFSPIPFTAATGTWRRGS